MNSIPPATPRNLAADLCALLARLLLAFAAVPALGAIAGCEGIPVLVICRDEADARAACQGAAEAIAFLRGQGLNTAVPLEVDVVDDCVERHGWPVMGQTDTRTMRIEILSYAACQRAARERPTLGTAMSPDLHRSFVAHEVAHAIAQFNFAVPRPPVAAHEYVAYVTQFATMAPELRRTILARHDNAAWERLDDISEMVYFLAPEVFAVKSYRHFLASPHPREDLARLLGGRVGRQAQ